MSVGDYNKERGIGQRNMWQWFLAQEAAGLLINCVAVFLSGYYIFEDDRIQYSLMALAALGLLGFLPWHSWSFLRRVALISRAVLVWGLLSLVCAFRIHPSPVIQLRLWGSAVRLRSLIPDESLQQFR